MSLLYHHRSACPVRSTWTCSKRRAPSEVMAWGDFYFLRGLKALPPMNAWTYWLIFGPQYSRVGENEGGHAGMAFLQFCFDSTISNKTS